MGWWIGVDRDWMEQKDVSIDLVRKRRIMVSPLAFLVDKAMLIM